MDRFREIVTRFKAQSPGMINVLGVLDVGDVANWDNAMAGIADYRTRLTGNASMDGFYFDNVPDNDVDLLTLMEVIADHIDQSNRSACIYTRDCTHINNEDITVFGLKSPLFNQIVNIEDGKVVHPGAPDVWITLFSSWTQMGKWTPFSWYPGMIPAKWGAMVFGAPYAELGDISEALYDRGYGNIFLHSENDVNVPTDHLFYFDLALRDVGAGAERRLAAPEGGESFRDPMWACDDTRFACEPICLQTEGKVTVEVDKKLCTKPVDPCLCNDLCYYDVRWEKLDREIKCLADQNGKTQQVADMVCTYRGAPKPSLEDWDSGKVQKGTRGNYPDNMDKCWKEEETDDPAFFNSFGVRAWLAALFWLLA
jgi:hypothetical protein